MVGERIKFLREKIGITQKEMGEAIGKSWRTIQDYEYQKSTPPLRTLKMIAVTYGVSLKWLETGDGEVFESKSSGNYQNINGDGNIQVNSGSVTSHTKLDPELINLLERYATPALISDLKEKLKKIKKASE